MSPGAGRGAGLRLQLRRSRTTTRPNVGSKIRPGSVTQTSEFSTWYRTRLGHRPVPIQATLWLLYGFVWIPVWYLTTGAKGHFSDWYRTRLGERPPVAQIALWVLYGFIWIPVWYVASRNSPAPASDQRRTRANESAVGSRTPVNEPNEPRPDAVWPAITASDRVRGLFTVRAVATEITDHADSADSLRIPARVLRWNYTRLFAFGWAALSVAVGLRNAPRSGGPSTVDLFFLMVGLLYVVFVAVQVSSGSYWHSFFVEDHHSELPESKLRLLAASALGGLSQVMVAAALVGVALAVGIGLRR